MTLARRLAAAAGAYDRDRYPDTLRITRGVLRDAPKSATAHELYGLACYRLGRWQEAARHLEESRSLSGEPDPIPTIMDCQRAMGRHGRVEALWNELRAASPPADVLVEGRLVLAADLADRGNLAEAIAVLTAAGAQRRLRHPADRHLRQWYVLADLYERAGNVPSARELFGRVRAFDPGIGDVPERLAALGPRARRAARSAARGRR